MNLELNDFQKKLLDESVEHVEYLKLGQKTTVAFVTAVNGFEITGTSGCVDPKDFNFEIGKHFALVDALNQLGKFQGFYRQQVDFQVSQFTTNHTIVVNTINENKGANGQKIAEEIVKNLKREDRKKGL